MRPKYHPLNRTAVETEQITSADVVGGDAVELFEAGESNLTLKELPICSLAEFLGVRQTAVPSARLMYSQRSDTWSVMYSV